MGGRTLSRRRLGLVLTLALSLSGGGSALAQSSGETLASDTASLADPIPFWGSIDCHVSSRHQQLTTGGDTHLKADGTAQGDTSFRRLTVIDGDDFWGERCELGDNDHWLDGDPNPGPTVFYTEGNRRITYMSFRLPSGFPLSSNSWQVVMQMKQTGPADNSGGTPALALNVYNGRWRLHKSSSVDSSSLTTEIWSAPAATGIWTRFAFDVKYSTSSTIGSVKVYVDLNNDGDFVDSGETSSTLTTYTLKREGAGTSTDGLAQNAPIPSHLRAGIYHDTAYVCPSPTGCYVDLDNVQIVDPESSAYSTAVRNHSPAGYWRFRETGGTGAVRQVGSVNGIHGSGVTLNAAALRTALGPSADYNGLAGAETNFGDKFDFSGNQPFSIELWARPDVVDSTYRRLVSKQDMVTGTEGYTIFSVSGVDGIGFQRFQGGVGDTVKCSALSPGVTYHIVGTYDGSTLRLYRNGTECASIASARSVADTAGPFLVGNTSILSSRNFDGRIDEPAVYTRALSAAEVLAHYQAAP